jgi:two-component system, NtrC family, C4-dicarboxylate transport sensor histidine kinase DctB
MHAEVMTAALRRGDPPRAASWNHRLAQILAATAEAESLVTDLLTLDRLSARARAPTTVDVRRVIAEIITRERAALERSRSQVTVTYKGDGDVTGRWDRGHLTRILSNLLRNSIAHAAGAPIRITVQRTGGRLRIDFADRGPGFAVELGARPPRSNRRRSRASPGLGLWIVRDAVAGMSGTLRVRSNARTGTRFQINLPAAAANAT